MAKNHLAFDDGNDKIVFIELGMKRYKIIFSVEGVKFYLFMPVKNDWSLIIDYDLICYIMSEYTKGGW